MLTPACYLPPPTPPWPADELGSAILKAVACLASIAAFGFGFPILIAAAMGL